MIRPFAAFIFLCFIFFSCQDDKVLVEHTVRFSISAPTTLVGGRLSTEAEPQSVLVTITDDEGEVVADRRELQLYKFGETYLSAPLTLKTNSNNNSIYELTEFFVTDAGHSVRYATPKEGSVKAHLVDDPLKIEFSIDKDAIATIIPEVLEVDENSNPTDFGYGQFGFNIVNTIEVVFSSFIKGTTNFELTSSHLKVEGLSDSQPDANVLWSYETDLEAKANVLSVKAASQYRITATKHGYKTWIATNVLTNKSRTEIILEEAEEVADVYVAGYVGRDATYWKNGVPFTLERNANFSSATSIEVSDNDVYVTGSNGELPVYWKNGEKKLLEVPLGTIKGHTGDIAIKNGDVYICGDYVVQNNMQPAYWKNGVRVDLQIPSSFIHGSADKIEIVGSDVYASGFVRSSHTTMITAALWVNGKFKSLPVPGNYAISRAQGLKVSAEGNVYVSGYITTSATLPAFYTTMRAVYWKDGEMQFIESTKQSYASGLDIVGNDVFIPYSDGKAHYWKNGEKIHIDGEAIIIYELAVSNGDVYLTGTYKSNPDESATACYWVNGERVLLQSEKESQATSCFIVKR